MEKLGNIVVYETFLQPGFEEAVKKLETAIKIFNDGGKETVNNLRQAEEERKLLMVQRGLEMKLKKKFLGISVNETIFRLLVLGNEKHASRLKSDFKVTDKRYSWIRLRAIAELQDWTMLHAYAREKKTPLIGWKPFADVCIAADQPQEAARYITKIPDADVSFHHMRRKWVGLVQGGTNINPSCRAKSIVYDMNFMYDLITLFGLLQDKMKLWMSIEYWREAADIAKEQKNARALQHIRAKCNNKEVEQYIAQLMASLK